MSEFEVSKVVCPVAGLLFLPDIFGPNRILHRFPMQTEKSQPGDKRIMPDMRFTEFPALSVDSRGELGFLGLREFGDRCLIIFLTLLH